MSTALAPTAAPEEIPRTERVRERVADHGLYGDTDRCQTGADDRGEHGAGKRSSHTMV